MQILLNNFDARRVEQINVTMQTNGAVAEILDSFLQHSNRLVTADSIKELVDEYEMEPRLAYAMLIASACVLDIYHNQVHKELFNDYFAQAVREIEPGELSGNPFIRNTEIIGKTYGQYTLSIRKYAPYEAFIVSEAVTTSDFREIPQIGFFATEASFPAIYCNGSEVYSLSPLEISATESAIENAHGRVLCYGVGIGYFAYLASGKSRIENITIVENNSELVDFFTSAVISQFPNSSKVRIINAEPLSYAENDAKSQDFDYTFCRCQSLNEYIKMRRIVDGECDFYLENTYLNELRQTVFQQMYTIMQKSNESDIKDGEKVVRTYQEFVGMLSEKGLKEMI